MTLDVTDSILNSVKKLLGYEPEYTEFDPDILTNINAAIFTLRQIGIGSNPSFIVSSEDDTYADYLGDDSNEIVGEVGMYLYAKTKLVFDTPQSGYVVEMLKEQIKEAEWRLEVHSGTQKPTEPDEEVIFQND